MKYAKASTYMSMSFDKIAFLSPNPTKNSDLSFSTTREASLPKEKSGVRIVDDLHSH